MGRRPGDQFESDAGRPTRWRTRNVLDLRSDGAPLDWDGSLRGDGADLSAGLDVARKSERIRLRDSPGGHVARTSPATGTDGTTRHGTHDHRHSDADCFCA